MEEVEKKIKRLEETNEILAEAIRAGEGSEEDQRVMFDAHEENRELIEQLRKTD